MKKDVKKTDLFAVSDLLRDYIVRNTKKIAKIIAEKTPPRVKALAATWLITIFSHANVTPAEAIDKPDNNKAPSDSEISTEPNHSHDKSRIYNATPDFDKSAQKLKVKTGGIYKGIKLNFAEMEAPDLGHVFEAGMNPYILSPDKKYLGLYQMEISQTVKSFLFGVKRDGKVVFPGVATDYPKLAELGKTAEKRRSREFAKLFGDLSKTSEFRHKMDNFMDVTSYQPVYAALNTIPGLDFDKRGEVFKATVMTAVNQKPDPEAICAIFKDAMVIANGRAARENRNTSTADIIDASYEVRTKRWASGKHSHGLNERYREESRLSLDWLKYEEKMNELKLARDKMRQKHAENKKLMEPAMAFNPVSNLLPEIKSPTSLPTADLHKKIAQKRRNGR